MINKFKSRRKFYIVNSDQKCTIIRKCWIFVANANCEWMHCYFIQHVKAFNCDDR